MKLRNKKTGTIVDVLVNPIFTEYNRDGSVKNINTFNSLAELNEEWEDYEEPKEYWHIDFDGSLMKTSDIKCDKDVFDRLKEVGNYFDTREEAEKAVEKLKAWKRLKDKGFKVKLVTSKKYGYLEANWQVLNGDFSDVHLLFGGEE